LTELASFVSFSPAQTRSVRASGGGWSRAVNRGKPPKSDREIGSQIGLLLIMQKFMG
jgi:hypothetical protein